MSHVPEKSIHVFIETEGIHPSLNSELQCNLTYVHYSHEKCFMSYFSDP